MKCNLLRVADLLKFVKDIDRVDIDSSVINSVLLSLNGEVVTLNGLEFTSKPVVINEDFYHLDDDSVGAFKEAVIRGGILEVFDVTELLRGFMNNYNRLPFALVSFWGFFVDASEDLRFLLVKLTGGSTCLLSVGMYVYPSKSNPITHVLFSSYSDLIND